MPRPVPSMVLFLISSILSNGEKSFDRSSSLIPIPVSTTWNFRYILSSSSASLKPTFNVTVPFSVYLTAFVRILVTHCFILTSSPKSLSGVFSSTLTITSSPLSSAFTDIMFKRSLTMELKWYSTLRMSIFPASILEKSRMSLTIPRRELPALLTFCAYSLICGSLFSLRIISFIPRTAFIGVLISWDIFERKLLLASLAFFATSRSISSCCSCLVLSI